MKWINASALAHFDTLPASAYVRLPVMKAMFGVSASTIWRWSRIGALPRPTKISGTTLWRVGEIRERVDAKSLHLARDQGVDGTQDGSAAS